MQLTGAVVLISGVVALYVLAIWYVLSRKLWRALRDKQPRPMRIELIVKETQQKCVKFA